MKKPKQTRLMELYEERKAKGDVNDKIELGRLLWPDSQPGVQSVNTTNLFKGKTKRIDFEWPGIICRWLKCEPNELFTDWQEEAK